MFSGAEPFYYFGKGAWEEHFCEIILKSAIGLGDVVLIFFYF